jgi:hypothetical protein
LMFFLLLIKLSYKLTSSSKWLYHIIAVPSFGLTTTEAL